MNIQDQTTRFVMAYYPNESVQKQESFKRSVAYLISGWSADRYGGLLPSIREFLVRWWVKDPASVKFDNWSLQYELPLPKPGEWKVDEAYLVCEAFCFRTLPKESTLRIVALESCSNDDPEDLELIEEWEIAELKQLRSLGYSSAKKPSAQQWNRLRFLKEKLGASNEHEAELDNLRHV